NVLATDNAGNRRQVDDRPAAIGDHGRDRVLNPEEHAGRVDRHDAVPGFGTVKVLFGAARNTGIVDQHIELAEMSDDGGHYGGPVLFFGDIEGLEPRRVADGIGHLLAFILKHFHDHNLGTSASEL